MKKPHGSQISTQKFSKWGGAMSIFEKIKQAFSLGVNTEIEGTEWFEEIVMINGQVLEVPDDANTEN